MIELYNKLCHRVILSDSDISSVHILEKSSKVHQSVSGFSSSSLTKLVSSSMSCSAENASGGACLDVLFGVATTSSSTFDSSSYFDIKLFFSLSVSEL